MADHRAQHLVQQWQTAMEAVINGAAGRVDLPQPLATLLERQIALVQEVIEREQRLQRDVLSRAFEPLDAVFDLFEESAVALGEQADALQASARALEHAAELMRVQSELSGRAIATLRSPARLAKRVGGVEAGRNA